MIVGTCIDVVRLNYFFVCVSCSGEGLEDNILALPLVLAGPILRRVEPNLVSVWLALRDASDVKLALWENQIEASDAEDSNIWFRSPDPVKTLRIGDSLHLVVVTLRLPSGKTLVPERLYSYDVEITPQNQTTKETLNSLGLLQNNPPNSNPNGVNVKHLALGYEPELLPCLVLPPKELKDLKIVHGSCRDIDTSFPDALAYLDDLFSTDETYKSAINRPHQLFLTGDQIYADEVPRPLLAMLNATAQTLIGTTREHLPFRDESQPKKVITAEANLTNFPVGVRHNVLVNEAGMTTNDGASHLMSFGEFCAMYLYVWSNVCWEDQLDNLPARESLPPADAASHIAPPVLRKHFSINAAGEGVLFPEYEQVSYETDIAQLREFHRTLPKVRRALANVPSYMMFDDHEVTDDWYLTQTWRDRALGSPLGSAIIRNAMLSYALFQGWGNDPVKFEPRAGITEKQPHEELLELAAKFFTAGAATAPDITTEGNAAGKIDELLGLTLRNEQASDGSYAETEPKLKWFYTVPGTRHQTIVLDCRTRRSFASRISPPGNIGKEAQKEQIPDVPNPSGKEVWFIVSSLPVLGPPIFDELLAPLLYKVFDVKSVEDLQKNRGTKRMPGTNPDAVEAWCFDPVLFEVLLKRLKAYGPVIVLSGDVHYSATNAMSYWKKGDQEPTRIVQFISSGLKNVMPEIIQKADRSFAILQKMTASDIGAERLGWEKNSPMPVQVLPNSDISPRLRGMLNKQPVLIPTTGWRGATASELDWAWRVSPIRDIREEKDRPKMARAVSLFPDNVAKKDKDIDAPNMEGYHRTAERHFRQLDRLNNCRQILFSSNIGVISFQKRTEKDKDGNDVEITYAIQDLYTAKEDPDDLVNPPRPEVFTRHEVPLRDIRQKQPKIK
jgi:hypothetical protein